MKNIQIGLLVLTTLTVTQACGGGKKGGAGAPAPATSDSTKPGTTGGDTSTGTDTTSKPGTDTTSKPGTDTGGGSTTPGSDDYVYRAYTGFDGQTKFRYIYGFYGEDTKLVLSDPSMAKVEQFSYTIPQAKLDAAIAAVKAKGKKLDEAAAKDFCGGTSVGTAIVPLKAGTFMISDTYKYQDEGGKEVEQTDKTEMTVFSYTPAQVAKGKDRYTKGIGAAANQKACVSCHGTGLNGAPAHDLGGISYWEDSVWEQWVTTGKRTEKYSAEEQYTYEASIGAANHSWAFTNTDEMKATLAYVRSIEASDTDTYAEKALARCVEGYVLEDENTAP